VNAYNYPQTDINSDHPQSSAFDPYGAPTPGPNASSNIDLSQTVNPYPLDTNGYSQTYFPNAPTHSQFVRLLSFQNCPLLIGVQLQHHLYAPVEAQQKFSKSNQRTARDLFIPEDLRRKLQAKTDASLKTFPSKFTRHRDFPVNCIRELIVLL